MSKKSSYHSKSQHSFSREKSLWGDPQAVKNSIKETRGPTDFRLEELVLYLPLAMAKLNLNNSCKDVLNWKVILVSSKVPIKNLLSCLSYAVLQIQTKKDFFLRPFLRQHKNCS